MVEKRREKRMPISLHLDVSSLYKQDNEKVENLNAAIEVIDISKSGIGFQTESILPLGFYFNARLAVGTQDLKCVVRIVRSQPGGEGLTIYGCEFVGMAPVLDYIFEEYEGVIEN